MKKPGPEWAKTRANHLATYPECRVCGDEREPVVHHIRYRGKRGASEISGDLVTLCSAHHDQLHRLFGSGSEFVFDAVRKSIEWMRNERAMLEDDAFRDAMDS